MNVNNLFLDLSNLFIDNDFLFVDSAFQHDVNERQHCNAHTGHHN